MRKKSFGHLYGDVWQLVTVVIILQCVQISNHFGVYLKLIKCYMSIIPQLKNNSKSGLMSWFEKIVQTSSLHLLDYLFSFPKLVN